MRRLGILVAISVFTLAAASRSDYKVEEREPIHQIFTKDTSLDIDSVSGSITVTGDGGNTIRVEGEFPPGLDVYNFEFKPGWKIDFRKDDKGKITYVECPGSDCSKMK